MLPTSSQNLTLQEAFETAAQKKTEFDGAFFKKFKLLIDRFSSFSRSRKRRKSVENMIHQKKNRDHRTSKSLRHILTLISKRF